jgi:transcriptional regulator CtsR
VKKRNGGSNMQIIKIIEKPTTKPILERKPLITEELQREYDYIQSVKILHKMLDEGLITQEEFHKIDHLNRQSFSPLYTSLMS